MSHNDMKLLDYAVTFITDVELGYKLQDGPEVWYGTAETSEMTLNNCSCTVCDNFKLIMASWSAMKINYPVYTALHFPAQSDRVEHCSDILAYGQSHTLLDIVAPDTHTAPHGRLPISEIQY